MQIGAKLPWIACIVAFIMAGADVIDAVTGQIITLPFVLIPLSAAIGILRKRVWSAYGFALFHCAQVILAVAILLRPGGSPSNSAKLITVIALSLILACLFLFAGRSLASAGAARGRPWPWIAISAAITLPLFFLQPFVIPTGAMEDTLLIGDRILVRRFPKPAVARGDVVVFAYPVDQRQTFVKRVIGVPGDRIRITRKIAYLNGSALREPYAVHKTEYEDSYRDNFPSEPNARLATQADEMLQKHVVNGEVVVPKGSYFVMGDNRDSSLDSRYWGFVPSSDIIGKPVLIYDSREQSSAEITSGSVSRQPRMRWGRLFKLL